KKKKNIKKGKQFKFGNKGFKENPIKKRAKASIIPTPIFVGSSGASDFFKSSLSTGMSTPCPLNLVLANPRANTMAPIMAKIFPSVVAGANCDKIDEASVCNPAA